MKWKKPLVIPDGKHKGIISRVETRTEPFEYTDVFIKLEDVNVELKYGCPSFLSENSKLGRLCIALGAECKPDEDLDVVNFLKGNLVEFMTMVKKSKDGSEFAEIVTDSIKHPKDE